MSSMDELERDDEEMADYEVGFQDRLDCAAYEGLTDEELFETKRTTVEQMWARLEEVWRANRNLGPGWSRGWKAVADAQLRDLLTAKVVSRPQRFEPQEKRRVQP